jgi:hypothetical protein
LKKEVEKTEFSQMDIGSTIKESFIAEQQNKYVELVVYHSAFQLLVYD